MNMKSANPPATPPTIAGTLILEARGETRSNVEGEVVYMIMEVSEVILVEVIVVDMTDVARTGPVVVNEKV